MSCEYTDKLNTDDKRPDENIQLSNNKILSLDSMASIPIDDIVNMYRQGYILEERNIENDEYIHNLTYATEYTRSQILETLRTTTYPGTKTDIHTVSAEQNIITVATETTLRNNIVVDKIDIENKSTGVVVKSVVPTTNTTLISGIPAGTYNIIVTKTGYKTLICSSTPCEVTFTTEYFSSASITIILESLVKTCKLTITVTDKYIKPPKTQTTVSIDCATPQIAPNGVLDIPEITAGSHVFTIKADGYKDIVNKSETIECTTIADAITFQLDQIDDMIGYRLMLLGGLSLIAAIAIFKKRCGIRQQ